MTEDEIRTATRLLPAPLSALRLHSDVGNVTAIPRVTAVPYLTAAARPGSQPTRWYAGVTADEVAHQLERHKAYPLDLDAVTTADGVRFALILRK